MNTIYSENMRDLYWTVLLILDVLHIDADVLLFCAKLHAQWILKAFHLSVYSRLDTMVEINFSLFSMLNSKNFSFVCK